MAHIFNFSSLKFFYFLWDPYLSNGQRLLLAYPPNHHLPPFSSLHISFCHHHSHSSTQKLHSQFDQRSRTTKTLKNLKPPKAAHHPQIQNSIHTYLWYTMKKKRKKEELPDQKWASNGAVPCADHRASWSKNKLPDQIISNCFQRRSIVAVNADFDALTRSKNEYDSSDEENERMVELFSVWSKIDVDDLSAWVGVGRRVSDWRVSDRCEWLVSMSFLLWRRTQRRTDKEEERKKKK